MDLNESEVVAASSESCLMTGFGISHDESLDYAITVLLSYLVVIILGTQKNEIKRFELQSVFLQ
jgi:hypothetical protein